ncbi:MAG: exodeoxyribonuclease III [Paludibacteraceae bacterium]|nr:exodeoxyribonuclease III [Paludibacteraceae bacterium]MBP8627991.1 exodeoxyribonuclease III [Paludibacteraceae bacterium]MBP9648491.1 exodeoxyribonuclease III [Paludibacteraceae bacterium]HOR41142.1 exodeoxyribonuclease III [Paludibacteraceae bacterium]HPL94569.1 exodeoxyribonuclease III [Paludibacteraceae bacterium]
MNIISYNVNGIRSAISKGLIDWIKEENPDVLCFQETKAQPEQIDTSLFEALGYHCYFHSAEKKGYSGVAILSKTKPDNVVIGMGNPKYDSEGRVIRADFGDISVMSVYVPSGTTGGIRQDFKMEFLYDFTTFIHNLRLSYPKLVISGDYNIAHKPIDINHPERQVGVSGFLPEERDWLTDFLESGFTDSFRAIDPSPEKYSWWSYRAGARTRNMGWRIDYHLISQALVAQLKHAAILSDVVHSDHCPVSIDLT